MQDRWLVRLIDITMNYGTKDESDLPEETVVERLINPTVHPIKDVLSVLLQDKSTKKNIIWATDAYSSHGESCSDKSPMFPEAFSTGNPVVLMTRSEKEIEEQKGRTRVKAEVFTPGWVCNLMNNYCDEVWFGCKDVFNTMAEDHTWTSNADRIRFPDGRDWKQYIDSRRLEITCGEAPFLASRYDVSNGDLILPLTNRIGVLDRKLRVVNENAESKEEWEKWVIRAFQSCYGYEWQGDNLLIARINLLLTFHDYYTERWGEEPNHKLLHTIAQTIAWNLWQMDGLTDTVPFGKPFEPVHQMTLFDDFDSGPFKVHPETVSCKIYDWRRDNSTPFHKCKERVKMNKKKLFDFVIGNPPYQETQESTSDIPIYNFFMDAAYEVGEKVMLITPGRFLFNAGKTPKKWMEKILADPHLKVLLYEQNGANVFPNTDIKGGVTITYRDDSEEIGPIGTFFAYPELSSILDKVRRLGESSFSELVYAPETYKFSQKMLDEHPEIPYNENGQGILSKDHDYDVVTNIFDKLDGITFYDKIPDDGKDYVEFIGRKNNKRTQMYIRRDYIEPSSNLDRYKVILSKSNGRGSFGEVLAPPIVGNPGVGHTQTFISIGSFETASEAKNTIVYIKTKFARAMLGLKKVTQDNKKAAWAFIPIQNFTDSSDIDWSKSVPEIDQQLYHKYGFSEDEIAFIESHVEEMT